MERVVENSKSRALRKGLFIIGCARSGTTILQDALNDCDEIFLFGEPDFHSDPATPDFAQRYNDMHRSWRNQPTKSTYCPALFDGDAEWKYYYDRLSGYYKYVGAKIVLNTSTFLHDPERILRFYTREFYDSHFIFTFRNPLDVSKSSQELQSMLGGDVASFEILMAGFVAALSLCVVMLRNLPNVHVVFHENMTRRTFAQLEKALGVRLSRAARYYDRSKVRTYDVNGIRKSNGETAELVLDLYLDFRQMMLTGVDLVQIGQNNANPSPNHLTPLGKMTKRCDAVSQQLTSGRVVLAR